VIKIGDFARLSQVTVPTLRHYDEVGLLKPISVDSVSGYRYYSVSQLPRFNRILALKDLGFTLLQIENVLNGGLTPAELRGMLRLKHAEVEQHVAAEQARLDRIAARLRQIEQEGLMAEFEVVLKTVSPLLIAACKVTIPTNEEASDYLCRAYKEVFDHMKTCGVTGIGPNLALWHQAPEVVENEVAEAAVPIQHVIPDTQSVKIYELPSTQVASAVHHGAFENFTQLHTALHHWVEANQYQVVGPYREIYLSHNSQDLGDSVTEIQYPVAKN
jgi:DNA-binding transcriptional MerR regulator